MKQKIIAGALFVVALLLIGAGYLIAYRPDLLGICPLLYPDQSYYCLDQVIIRSIAFPLMELEFLLPLFLLVAFIRADVFKLWWKFALPFGLFLAILAFGHDPFGGMFENSRREATSFCTIWFVISSLLLIASKTWFVRWRAYYTIPVAIIFSLVVIGVYLEIT